MEPQGSCYKVGLVHMLSLASAHYQTCHVSPLIYILEATESKSPNIRTSKIGRHFAWHFICLSNVALTFKVPLIPPCLS